jgi:CheY-like chemotaxis protein
VTVAYERLRLVRQLRETDRKKDEFLATLAHELRNPLAPVRNAIEFLKLTGSDDPDLQNARDIIERQIGHLARLVDDLLDVSRITRGKIALKKERLGLGLILTSAVEASRPIIAAAGHELTVTLPSEPVYLDGDLTRLVQVFANILVNAAKYTDRGGRIWLTAEREGSDVAVSIRDSALARTQGGLGIGLSLVKGLVELHGGAVAAKSGGPGTGSEFIVRLPLLVESPNRGGSQPADPKERPARGPRRRIVVADDNVDSAQSLAMMLSLMGHEVSAAHDGQGALELAETIKPDVILLDIGMPRLNGYEAARRIRKQQWGQDVLLVALTGWGQDEDKRRAEEAGFDHHFTKPVAPAALAQLLAGPRDARLTIRS